MNSEQVFLTGGTGFLGRHLIPRLCRAGYTIRLLTRQPEHYSWLARYPRIEIVRGDLRADRIIHQAVQGCRFVIHAGGFFRFWGKPEDFQSTNIHGTENVLRAALDAKVERLVHISTVAVIGQPDPVQVMDETYPPNPVEPYQQSKLQAEQLALRYFHEHKLPVVVLRPGAYYGPMGEYAFNRLFFTDPMRGLIMQLNRGRYIIFPAFIADVAESVMLALARGRVGEIYNICGDSITHKEGFDIVCHEAGLFSFRPPVPDWLGIMTARVMEAIARLTQREPFWPLNLRSYVYNYWRVSNEKARRELGFVPTDFRSGARQTIAWYRAGKPDHLPELDC
ncbi:MAG: NAD-dependent epimerase/dehydratase family protein [Chloroflexi bacterium]|nr:NAD-dependent epimerase/dehydratase family protein [Chloroflexota bacterium]